MRVGLDINGRIAETEESEEACLLARSCPGEYPSSTAQTQEIQVLRLPQKPYLLSVHPVSVCTWPRRERYGFLAMAGS
jgi:hypothetical protein